MDDGNCKFCDIGDAPVCIGEGWDDGPNGMMCTREDGHKGKHVACGIDPFHAWAKWAKPKKETTNGSD